ncbi:hypothetical protein EDP1_4203 [Pseudomonas putida S610]|nr:hypothetical protein EDP1_4203 [Pseudomonas putida S610]
MHGSAWLTAAGEGDAIGQGQVGGLRRPHKVWRRHAGGGRNVACRVGQGDLEATAILDGGVQAEGEGAIGADSARGDQVACRVAHLHSGAGFAAAGQLGAC